MRILLRLAYKDYLVIVRDRAGLAMLFLMPLALVMIMTSLQDTTFRAINESGIKMVILNGDRDSLGMAIEQEIKRSDFFDIRHEIDHKVPTEQSIREAVAAGRFQIGMIIPPGATQHIRDQVKTNVAGLFPADSTDSAEQPAFDSLIIQMYIDPATKNSMRSTLQGSIREFAARIESRIILNELTLEINKRMMLNIPNLNGMNRETVFYREEYVAHGNKNVIPNSAQHNVPAWTLFAMFFIVIPFASAMIREKEDGSLSRLLTMPGSYATILLSKILVYLAVCYLQFISIMMMGVYLFPLVGLPALFISGKVISLTVIAFAAALAAIGYGIAVGTIARTHQQAAIFGSISVVILAAVGGIWVPIFMMPPFFRVFSAASPLNWGLNGFYDILVRNAGLPDVLHYGIWMVLFALLCVLIALYYHKFNKESV
jgi:ABC-2 type transport system permease protein